MAQIPRTVLYALLALLMVDCLIEVGFLGSMVGYLHQDHPMYVRGPDGGPVVLLGKPLHPHLSVDQGHTSNGAAGTALILVGLLGVLLLSLRRKLERSLPRYYSPLLTFWVVISILSFLLTLAALAYTFAITNKTDGQHINLTGLTSPIRYPYDKWTPQTWYKAILDDLEFLPPGKDTVVVNGNTLSFSSRSEVQKRLRVFNGWGWNLIVMFLLQFAITPLIILEYFSIRKERTVIPQAGTYKDEVTEA